MHRIHLHSFTGGLLDYQRWVRRHPQSIFGISLATTEAQATWDFGKLADIRKLVLETDTPYMTGSHASALAVQAEWLATHRGIPRWAVLGYTAHTTAIFYGLPV